jgi:serpin B
MKGTSNKILQLLIISFTIYAVLIFSGCVSTTADDSGSTPAGVAALVEANNNFSLGLYSQISKGANDNIFFSPWSISDAMAMVYEGARGDTANQIQYVFNFSEDSATRRSSFAKMLNIINKGNGRYDLYNANAIWLQKNYTFLVDYKNIISRYYLGEINNLDFVSDSSVSINQINGWISDHTNKRITQIVSHEDVNELTRAVLTNAIYFNGKWEHQFKLEDTSPEDFTLDSGEKISVPTMKIENEQPHFNYIYDNETQVLEMRYQGGNISMLLILPRNGKNITYLESILTAEKIREWRSNLYPRPILIYIPKYKFGTSYSLKNYLENMGMRIPFSHLGADFSGMDGTKNLYISHVLHKAYIDVSENGTEAAAATDVSLSFTSAASPLEFRADHPFIFIIQETETGNILFMGRVMDPSR